MSRLRLRAHGRKFHRTWAALGRLRPNHVLVGSTDVQGRPDRMSGGFGPTLERFDQSGGVREAVEASPSRKSSTCAPSRLAALPLYAPGTPPTLQGGMRAAATRQPTATRVAASAAPWALRVALTA